MKARDFSLNELAQFSSRSFFLYTGPFVVSVNSTIPLFAETFRSLYQDNKIAISEDFADYHVSLSSPLISKVFNKPQIHFLLDGKKVFNPLPLVQVFPTFEWGLNWVIANHCNFYLVVHAGVVEKNGCGILMPATPGSGKSTLCAALCLQGWRLLSDELALIDLNTGLCIPVPRPVSLKDRSIELIRGFNQHGFVSETVHDTQKGSVAYLKVPVESIKLQAQPANLKAVIFPKFQAEYDSYTLNPISKARAMIRILEQTFNFAVLGERAFELLKAVLIDTCCFEFTYNGDLRLAESVFEQIIGDISRD